MPTTHNKPNPSRNAATDIFGFMNEEESTKEMQQPGEVIPPLDITHHSRDTRIMAQLKIQSLLQLDERQSNETNRNEHTPRRLTGSEACESVTPQEQEDAALETEPAAGEVDDYTEELVSEKTEGMPAPGAEEGENGREGLRKHRTEVASRVWIPDTWGQEEMLKDWIDCSVFDASLFPSGIMSARAALVARQGRRANPDSLRVENRDFI